MFNLNDKGGWIVPAHTTLLAGTVIPNYSTLGRGCELGHGCKLGPDCKLGAYCELGAYCKLGPGCKLGAYCELGEGCELGPGCKLGDGCELGHGCKLGEGCEVEGEVVTKWPVRITGLTYNCTITDGFMRLGCKRFTHGEWADFDDVTISMMDDNALEFWVQWRDSLLTMCKAHSGVTHV